MGNINRHIGKHIGATSGMSNNPFSVSIIIPAYNSEKTLETCLISVLRQTYPSDKTDIHVINDGSTDNTDKILRKMAIGKNIFIHTLRQNSGLASARNTGVQNSTGDIVIFLDSDMEVTTDFVENHVRFHEKPDVIGVLSAILPAPENPLDKYQKYLYFSRRGAKKYAVQSPIPFNVFILGITSVKRHAIISAGGFDDLITSYGGEDTELAYRLWQKFPDGLFYAPHIKVIHHHYRPFCSVLENVSTFGQNVVPYLVNKHSEFDKLYGYSFIFPPKTVIGLLKKITGIVLKSRLVNSIIKFLYHIFPYPGSNIFIRLLLASALWRGIARSETNPNNRHD